MKYVCMYNKSLCYTNKHNILNQPYCNRIFQKDAGDNKNKLKKN